MRAVVGDYDSSKILSTPGSAHLKVKTMASQEVKQADNREGNQTLSLWYSELEQSLGGSVGRGGLFLSTATAITTYQNKAFLSSGSVYSNAYILLRVRLTCIGTACLLSHGIFPVKLSHITIANAKTSHFSDTRLWLKISGAMYMTVPAVVF